MRFSQQLRKYLSEDGRRRANLRWAKDRERRATTEVNVDADTLRARALFDRKGKLVVSGVAIYYSTQRSDQFDLFVNNKLAITGGPRIIAAWLVEQAASLIQNEEPTFPSITPGL